VTAICSDDWKLPDGWTRSTVAQHVINPFPHTPALSPWLGPYFRMIVDRRTGATDVWVMVGDGWGASSASPTTLTDHPLVPRIRKWLTEVAADPAAGRRTPAFPVVDDPRPSPPIPPGGEALLGAGYPPAELWERLVGCTVTAEVAPHCTRFIRSALADAGPFAAAVALHPERRRCGWAVIRGGSSGEDGTRRWFSFAELATTYFDFGCARTEPQLVPLLAHAMLHRDGHTVTARWWNRGAKPHEYHGDLALGAMRTAAAVLWCLIAGVPRGGGV
jgi:hypothetical protein